MDNGVLDKRLNKKGGHAIVAFEEPFVHLRNIAELVLEAELFEIDIQLHGFHVLDKGYRLRAAILEDHPDKGREFIEVVAGETLLVLHDKILDAVQGIENKMRVHLRA